MSDFSGVMASLNSGGDSASSDTGSDAGTESPTVESTSSSDESSGSAPPPSSADDSLTSAPVAAGTGQPPKALPTTVPYARLSEVVEQRNTFEKQVQALSWAQAIPAEHSAAVVQLYQSLAQDPIGTLIREAEAVGSSDPDGAARLRSAAARWLGNGRQRAAAPAPAPVDLTPTLQSEDGQAVYTAPQVQAFVQKAVDQLRQQLQPLQADAQERKTQQILTTIREKARTQAAEIRQYPHFEENKAAIVAAMKADHRLSAEKAWMRVVLPKLTSAQQRTAVQTLNQKVQAGSTPTSRTPVSATAPSRPTSFKEAYAQVLAESRT